MKCERKVYLTSTWRLDAINISRTLASRYVIFARHIHVPLQRFGTIGTIFLLEILKTNSNCFKHFSFFLLLAATQQSVLMDSSLHWLLARNKAEREGKLFLIIGAAFHPIDFTSYSSGFLWMLVRTSSWNESDRSIYSSWITRLIRIKR